MLKQESETLTSSYRWTLGLLALGSLAVYLSFAWRPLDQLVAMFAGDDMFYYLQIARNIARGQGSTFDGITPTNGYHPIYMILVTGIFKAFPGKSPAFYAQASLTLLSVVGVSTGLILFAVTRTLFNAKTGLLVAGLWLLNPYIMGTVHIGVEVGLAAFMFAVSLYVYLRFTRGWVDRQPLQRETYVLGILLGLTCLCRTDSMFFAFCVGLAILYNLWRLPHTQKWWLHFVTFVAGGATVIFPWFGWNLAKFGSIVQDSARALTSLKHGLYLDKYGFSGVVTRKWPATFPHWAEKLSDILCLPATWITVLLLLGLMWAVTRTFSSVGEAGEATHSLPQRALLLALLAALGMHCCFYAGYFWFMQKWYFLSPSLLVVVLTGALVFHLERVVRSRWSFAQASTVLYSGVAVVAVALFVWSGSSLFQEGFYPWQKLYHDIGLQLKKAPKSVRFGAFNTGIYGYVMDRTVVNLDGVVNGQVLRAMKKKKLLAYLRKMKIQFVVDHKGAFSNFGVHAEPAFQTSFIPQARYPAQTTGGDIFVLRLRPLPKK